MHSLPNPGPRLASMRAAYFNCIGGISGDMVLGALVDAGLPIDSLRRQLSKLPLRGYEITASPDTRAAISGARVTVTTSPGPQPRRRCWRPSLAKPPLNLESRRRRG